MKTGPRTIVIPAGPEITDYLLHLADRAEKVRSRAVLPEEDNMLKISSDGRKAALDMRLITGEQTQGECKLERAARAIGTVWRATRELTYADPDSDEPSPIPGALQIVFCDLSTPSEGWNAYDELRSLLVAEGLPEHQIRFIHEARNDAEKGRLFASCRAGHVAVLIGSTEKMGVGTNIQARAIALHHLDCPWRPADIEQREGRLMRQGNQNPEVAIYRYVVERSFDAYSWQTVERKAKFISQVTRGRLDVRTVDDVGDSALSYTEVKALASGDPLILDHARASQQLTRLERLERAWGRNQQNLRHVLAAAVERTKARGGDLELIDLALARRTDTRGDRFSFTIGAVTHTERRAAADALARWAATASFGAAKPLGTLGGLEVAGTIRLDYTDSAREAVITLVGVPCEPAHATLRHLSENPLGLVRQLEHRVQDLDALKARTTARQQEATQEAERAREALERPFKHTDDLQDARRQLHEITERMQNASSEMPGGGDLSPPAGTSTGDTSPARDPRDTSPGPTMQVRYPPRPRPPALSPPVPDPQAARHLDHRTRQTPARGAER
ncbi:helicase-related protein [Conexibacter sp. DBS9H8]|uniref:helicase-related protein n=1 Tax=Conexibacter sp. DBS9H8 TaxID=2937801 RepID=UPI0020101164|nr:helicase-related protein [Conexibacter sp. DBS9H8]